jgi:hypothetical protein
VQQLAHQVSREGLQEGGLLFAESAGPGALQLFLAQGLDVLAQSADRRHGPPARQVAEELSGFLLDHPGHLGHLFVAVREVAGHGLLEVVEVAQVDLLQISA